MSYPPQGGGAAGAAGAGALIVYEGAATSDGAADGTTVVCSALTTKPDYNGNQIIITSGDYIGQARNIEGATTGGTVTAASAFGGKILDTVTFVITGIRTVPGAVADLQADVGDFSAQSNLKSLLTVLGSGWNTANKSLYTAIITDQLAHGTRGLSALKTLVDDLEVDVAAIDDAVAWRAMGDISGDLFYVKPDGDDTKDGTSWANAVKTIDHAMGLCTNDNYDGIIVARGDYDENANGALGVICDVSGVTILGVSGDIEIYNSDTTDNGAVFTITGWDMRFKNFVAYKGENTSTNPVVFNILDTPWATKYTKLYGIVALSTDAATSIIIKVPNGCNGVQINLYFNENCEFHGNGSDIGISFDATDLEIRDTKLSSFGTALSLGANATKTSISRDSIIEHCTTGILIAAGATNNVFNMAMPSNTTDITDNSGNATNDYHNSIAYIHHEMKHIPKRSGLTWYVDGTNGLDTNCGCNPDESFKTIAVALAAAGTGDTVVVMSKPGKYEETGLTMGTKGMELIFERGAILKEGAGGDALTVSNAGSDCKLTNVYIVNDNAGGKCFVITGDSCEVTGCMAVQGTVGFDVNADMVHFENCIAIDNSVTQFDISSKYGAYYRCAANGDGQAVRGFYLSDNTADLNTFISCHSLGNTIAGWEVVAGANENIFANCSMGGNDGAKVDAGANNSWSGWIIGSQITAGQALEEDSKDIYDDTKYILSTALTAPTVNSLARFIASGGTGLGQVLPASMSLIDLFGNFTGPYNGAAQDDNVKASLDLLHTDADRQEHISFFRSDMQASVTLDDTGTTDVSLPSVTIATGDLPTGHTIDAVYCHLKYGSRKDTSAADNAIKGTQYVQVKESVSGSYTNAVKIIDNGLPVDVSEATVMGGDVVFGNIDVVAEVAAENKTYSFQWTDCQVDADNLILYDVQTIIEVRWH